MNAEETECDDVRAPRRRPAAGAAARRDVSPVKHKRNAVRTLPPHVEVVRRHHRRAQMKTCDE